MDGVGAVAGSPEDEVAASALVDPARWMAARSDSASLAEHKPEIHPPAKETNVIHLTPITNRAADETFDEGMEHWWAGNRRRAVTSFRRALELDPKHADARNHLGIVSLEARKLKAAEQHFRAAIDGGQRRLERDGAEVHWGFVENRPYHAAPQGPRPFQRAVGPGLRLERAAVRGDGSRAGTHRPRGVIGGHRPDA